MTNIIDTRFKYWNDPILEYKWEGYKAFKRGKYIENPYDQELEPEKYYSWEYGYKCAYDDQVLVDMGR